MHSWSFLITVVPFVQGAALRREPQASVTYAALYAGATTAYAFPPAGATPALPDLNFPVATAIGYAGPTPTGDEAQAIATAPAFDMFDNAYPLLRPDTMDRKKSSFNVFQSWGNLAPWFSIESKEFGLPDASPLVPEGCAITQVHLVHRHGARYPTAGSASSTFATKLHTAASGAGFSALGPLAFLNDWMYRMGAEIMPPFGREQLYQLGVGFRIKYGALLKGCKDLPVFRTTTQERMVQSAIEFAAGFFGSQDFSTSYHQLFEVEEPGFNSTLQASEVCPNSGAYGGDKSATWLDIYTQPIIKRFSSNLIGVNLTSTDIVGMQQACAYETLALGASAFCQLFTEQEWKEYEYYNDLGFWYSNGPGNPNGAARGIGYVQELVSRLTQTRITEFSTSVNETIVSNPIYFPLDQPIYVDATHDNAMASIVTALNFTNLRANGPLPLDHIPKNQTWYSSRIAPFASNLVGQVLSCPASSQPTHIRFILNDGVVPLTGIQGCKEDPNGLCELSSFISGMKTRIAEVDFQFDCYANYTVSDPDSIIDGRFPAALRNQTQ